MVPSLEKSRTNSIGKLNMFSFFVSLNDRIWNRIILFVTLCLWMSQMSLFYQTLRQKYVRSERDLASPGFVTAIEKLKLLAKDMENLSELNAQNFPNAIKNPNRNVENVENVENIDSTSEIVVNSNPTNRKLFHKSPEMSEVLRLTTQGDDESSQSEEFIYVYEISTEYNLDLVKARIRWWSHQYEGEYELYDMIVRRNQSRTMDPEKATLFYIPFFSARYMLLDMKADGPDEMKRAIQKTSQMWEKLLKEIRGKYSFFNRSNGRDHFSAMTIDHGRCQAVLYCDPALYGEMFFFQLNGDKMVRSSHATTARGIQALSYNYGVQVNTEFPDIPCYMPDRDIVMPPISTRGKIVRPGDTDRPIVALFRFSKGQHHGVPIPYFNHFIRKELLELYENRSIDGWSMGVKSEWATRNDWENSIFCICPPGHSQWTSRPVKAIVGGCIPINFYRDHDQPWQDELEHSRFSLNVDADQLDTLKTVIDNVLETPGKLQDMQNELEAVQEAFTWGPEPTNGARAYLLRSLKRRAAALKKTKSFITI